ncbi:MAG: hypothetical protein AAF449_11640 [Myxococcota bacterium]
MIFRASPNPRTAPPPAPGTSPEPQTPPPPPGKQASMVSRLQASKTAPQPKARQAATSEPAASTAATEAGPEPAATTDDSDYYLTTYGSPSTPGSIGRTAAAYNSFVDAQDALAGLGEMHVNNKITPASSMVTGLKNLDVATSALSTHLYNATTDIKTSKAKLDNMWTVAANQDLSLDPTQEYQLLNAGRQALGDLRYNNESLTNELLNHVNIAVQQVGEANGVVAQAEAAADAEKKGRFLDLVMEAGKGLAAGKSPQAAIGGALAAKLPQYALGTPEVEAALAAGDSHGALVAAANKLQLDDSFANAAAQIVDYAEAKNQLTGTLSQYTQGTSGISTDGGDPNVAAARQALNSEIYYLNATDEAMSHAVRHSAEAATLLSAISVGQLPGGEAQATQMVESAGFSINPDDGVIYNTEGPDGALTTASERFFTGPSAALGVLTLSHSDGVTFKPEGAQHLKDVALGSPQITAGFEATDGISTVPWGQRPPADPSTPYMSGDAILSNVLSS